MSAADVGGCRGVRVRSTTGARETGRTFRRTFHFDPLESFSKLGETYRQASTTVDYCFGRIEGKGRWLRQQRSLARAWDESPPLGAARAGEDSAGVGKRLLWVGLIVLGVASAIGLPAANDGPGLVTPRPSELVM